MPPKDLQPAARALLCAILGDPEIATCKAAAEAAGIPYATAKRHWKALKEAETLKERLSVNPDFSPLPRRALIEITVDLGALRCDRYGSQAEFLDYLQAELMSSEGAAFRGKILLEEVILMLGGSADIVIIARAEEEEILLDFVTNVIGGLPGVRRTTTGLAFSPRTLTRGGNSEKSNQPGATDLSEEPKNSLAKGKTSTR